MCDFCNKKDSIKTKTDSDDYSIICNDDMKAIILEDNIRKREYIYSIEYCPHCGNKLY